MRDSTVLTLFAVVVWTGLMAWTCGSVVHDLRETHGSSPVGQGAVGYAFLVLPMVWVVGLGAIALLKYLFSGRSSGRDAKEDGD